MYWIIILFLSALIVWCLGQLWQIMVRGRAPWFPTSDTARRVVLDRIKLTEGQVFVELGAGSGYLARNLAKRYPQSQIFAYEVSALPYWIGKMLGARCKNLQFVQQDIFAQDLPRADYFFVFTNPDVMQRLAEKFTAKPTQAILYSYVFQLPGIKATEVVPAGWHPVYIYQV